MFLSLTESWHVETGNVIINAIFGGSCVGLGIGIIVLAGGTTAGTTILAQIANKYLDVSTAYALLFFDLIVVLISLTVLPLQNGLSNSYLIVYRYEGYGICYRRFKY